MIDLSKSCIICKSDSDLDTKSVLRLDGDEYRVSICTGCEDEASPKTIKSKLVERMNVLKALCQETAAILGVEITLDTLLSLGRGGTVAATAPSPSSPPQVAAVTPGGVKVLAHPMKKKPRGKSVSRARMDDAIDMRTGKPILRNSESAHVFETKSGDVPALGAGDYMICSMCAGDGAINDVVCEHCGGAGVLAP